MITLCTHCQINWAQLHNVHVNDDETIDICPVCLSSDHLEEGDSITAYIMCPITARITDVDTGEEMIRELPALPYRGIPGSHYKFTQDRNQVREDAALDAYHSLWTAGFPAAAERRYFELLKDPA